MVGKCIEIKRKNRSLSRSKLARLLDVSEAYIYKIERGGHTPSAHLLCKMADIFNCSVDELLGRTSSPSDATG